MNRRSDESRFDTRQWEDVHLLFTDFRSTSVFTQPPIQWSPRTPSPKTQRSGLEFNHSQSSSLEVKSWWNYTSNSTYSAIGCRVSTNTGLKIWTVYIVGFLIIQLVLISYFTTTVVQFLLERNLYTTMRCLHCLICAL